MGNQLKFLNYEFGDKVQTGKYRSENIYFIIGQFHEDVHYPNLSVFCFMYLTVSSSGTVTYSDVRTFLKKQPNIMIQYKSIVMLNGTLAITGNHLIYARKTFAEELNPMYVSI